MKKRDFLKSTGAIALGAMLPSSVWAMANKGESFKQMAVLTA